MSTNNFPIRQPKPNDLDKVWIVNGESYKTEGQAISRQSQLEEELIAAENIDKGDPPVG